MYKFDSRIVVTLDAGATNLVFGAMRGCRFITEPLTLPSHADDLEACLAAMTEGFGRIMAQLPEAPVAISFAFPGPADYSHGIIGGYLPNFPSFRQGVALGPYLEQTFGIPVFINNDGDLFAFGEALCGALPEVNRRLRDLGSAKRYRNLLGYTFGTGWGVGIVVNDRLNRGDNSCVETFCLPHPGHEDVIVEEGVAIRAVKREYGRLSGQPDHGLEPKEICEIADGTRPGDRQAALKAFELLGRTAGASMATAAQLIDGLIVIGGGITAARRHFMPALLAELRGTRHTLGGEEVSRLQMKVYDLDDPQEFAEFARGDCRELRVPGSETTVLYDPLKRTGVTVSALGASEAISVGAYAFALSEIDAQNTENS